jgi:hypothetical protein
MNRHAVLAPLAASVALATASLAHAQEVTPWDIPPPSATLTRAHVMAELHEWRLAGAHDAGNAGPSDAVVQRRLAMNRLAQERHARAQELERQRLAAEAAARAQPSSVIAQSPAAAGPAQSSAVVPQVPAVVAPIDSSTAAPSAGMASTPADDQAPTPSPGGDAITNWNRERTEGDAAAPLPGKPEEAPREADASSVPLESEPVDEVEAAEPVEASQPTGTAPPATQQSSSELPRDGEQPAQPAQPAPNAYGYQEPDDKYAPPETEAAPEQAQPRPVR